MRLSKKTEYGLRALIDLGIAHSFERRVVSLSELADAAQLPVKFLEQILRELRRAGFVRAQRGKSGGFRIGRDMGRIKMGDLVRALEGPLAPLCCASQSDYQRCTCPDEEHCGLRMIMLDVRNAVASILDRYTLRDVVEVTLRKIRRTNAGHYFAPGEPSPPSSSPSSNPSDPNRGFLAEWLDQATTISGKDAEP